MSQLSDRHHKNSRYGTRTQAVRLDQIRRRHPRNPRGLQPANSQLGTLGEPEARPKGLSGAGLPPTPPAARYCIDDHEAASGLRVVPGCAHGRRHSRGVPGDDPPAVISTTSAGLCACRTALATNAYNRLGVVDQFPQPGSHQGSSHASPRCTGRLRLRGKRERGQQSVWHRHRTVLQFRAHLSRGRHDEPRP
jgi:hypothetical protein